MTKFVEPLIEAIPEFSWTLERYHEAIRKGISTTAEVAQGSIKEDQTLKVLLYAEGATFQSRPEIPQGGAAGREPTTTS